MKITRRIYQNEDNAVVREAWEIKYNFGWDEDNWKVVATCPTFNEAVEQAIAKVHAAGYEKYYEIVLNLDDFKKTENRVIGPYDNYVTDRYHNGTFNVSFWEITHYYYFT